MSLQRFLKQPIDLIDYDVDYSEWLAERDDQIQSAVASADPGVSLQGPFVSNGVVKTFVGGGTSGQKYKVSVTITTVGGRVKQTDFIVAVKEL